MTGHEEDQEEKLANAEDFPSDAAEQQFTCITHAVHLGIPQLELPNDVSRIPRNARHAEENQKGSAGPSACNSIT